MMLRRRDEHSAGLTLATPWRLLALVCTIGAILLTIVPIFDIDIYWHVEAGREIVAERSIADIGENWTFGPADSEWRTTQWLSEVILAGVHAAAGWTGISLLRLAVTAVFWILIGRLLLRRPAKVVAVIVYLAVLVGTLGYFQERPQLASLLFLPWLAALVRSLITEAGEIRWQMLPLTWLWANLHGLWVLVPATLGVIAFGYALSGKGHFGRAARIAIWGAGAAAVGALTPVGPRLLLAPLRFQDRTGHIAEWQPTVINYASAMVLTLLVVGIVVAWARQTESIPTVEICFVIVIVIFAMLAIRNVVPALVLLAPLVASRVTQLVPYADTVDSTRAARLLAVLGVLVAVTGLATITARQLTTDPLPDSLPLDAAQYLTTVPEGSRVFAPYDDAGVFIHWGRENVRLFVDGRADRYPVSAISDYYNIVNALPGWQLRLDKLEVDYVITRHDMPLNAQLALGGWQIVMRDDDRVVLRRSS